jgi:uncharacterized protein
MPNIDHHPPGTFTWIELATTDQNAAKTFYSSLFGWAPNDIPMGPGDFYTIFRIDDRDAAAGYTMRADEKAMGIPSHWNLYIAVEDVDASAESVPGLGGKVIAPPFDVIEAGRMAVVQDPTGAIFQVWKSNKNAGIGVTGVDGTLCWADLNTPDSGKAKPFYEALFDWNIALGDNDKSGYLHIKNGHEYIGGIPPVRDPKTPPHWMIYFLVSDVEASTAKAQALGAQVYMPAMDIEKVGKMAVIADPQGAAFALFTPYSK